MPRASNDIDYVKWKDPRTKTSKTPPPEPWLSLLRASTNQRLLRPGEAAVPPGTGRHNTMALFSLFFTDEMLAGSVGRGSHGQPLVVQSVEFHSARAQLVGTHIWQNSTPRTRPR